MNNQNYDNEEDSPPLDPVTARQWAFCFVEQWRAEDRLIRDLLIAAGSNASEQHAGARWAERLILRSRTIDAVLKEAVSRPRFRVQDPLWTLLELGAAELLFGPVKSQHAAISETVELCRFAGHPEWSGFLNGGLRGVQRLLAEDRPVEILPAVNSYPAVGHKYRALNQDIFPNPETEPEKYLSVAFSLPTDLAGRWVESFTGQELFDVAWSSLISPAMTVRINRMQVEPSEWITKCEQAEIDVEETEFPEAIRLIQSVRISELPGFDDGEFVIQDATAMHAARLLNPYPKQKVLDLCAGPGTKTTQIAELMLDQGNVIAAEIVEHRLEKVRENAKRLQYQCIETVLIDSENPEFEMAPFDAVLVDAPCSNTGVLGKRPEARWRYCDEEIEELNEIQLHLLDVAAYYLVEDEGKIVYSTCSIDSRENEELLHRWLQDHDDFTAGKMKTILPTRTADGGFCALLERVEQENQSQLE